MTLWPSGYDRLILDETESTNAQAARIASRIEAEREAALRARTRKDAPLAPPRPLWILAHRQTSGRGRRGRSWVTGEGDLAATLLTFPDCGAGEAALRSFVASLAVADLCAALGAEEIAMKWPNDVLLKGRKAAGILLESASGPSGLRSLAVGVGVNLTPVSGASIPNPESAPLPAIGVPQAGGERVEPERALAILAGAWDRWERRLIREGFAPLRAAWLARAARLGETIEVRNPATRARDGGCRIGVFQDVDATGALVLATPNGVERIAAADVFFPDLDGG